MALLRATWAKFERPYLHNKIQTKKAVVVAQVVECFPSVQDGLRSIPITTKQFTTYCPKHIIKTLREIMILSWDLLIRCEDRFDITSEECGY
jgi:hypothetical protein